MDADLRGASSDLGLKRIINNRHARKKDTKKKRVEEELTM